MLAGLAAGCADTVQRLDPAQLFTGEDDAQVAQALPPTAPAAGSAPPPVLNLNESNIRTVSAAAGPVGLGATGTAVGRRIGELQGELNSLQTSVAGRNGQLASIRDAATASAQEYFGLVAAINARLQVGTTPGNPILVSQLQEAQLQLDDLGAEIGRMNGLASAVAGDSSLAAFLLETVRATYGLTGAVEEDHRQLAILEDEVNRTVVAIDRLLTSVSDDIARHTNYVNFERRNLQVLQNAVSNGELLGGGLLNQAFRTAPPAERPAATAAARTEPVGPATGARPLAVIRFENPNVSYERQVFQAITEVLDVRPEARFDIVGISPAGGNAADQAIDANRARGHAEEVLRTLVNLGLPPARLTLSSNRLGTATGPEVHLFVR